MFAKQIYTALSEELSGRATLVVVSKKHSTEEIQTAYDMGQRIFGENKANELESKAAVLPADIQWHFIGHLQRNKVRQILPYVSLIQSLDSLRLAETIEKEAARIDKTIDCLLEFHLAQEDTNKTGLSVSEAETMMEECGKLPHLRIRGMMAMGPHTEDEDEIRRVFEQGKALFDSLQKTSSDFTILSMGMSDDYPIAVSAGANMVRIGSKLFQGETI